MPILSDFLGSLSIGIDENYFRDSIHCRIGFLFDLEFDLNAVNKVLPVLITIGSSFNLLDLLVNIFN